MAWWKSAVSNWRKFQRLSRVERWVFVQALVLLPLTALALRWLGFKRWLAVLKRLAPREAGPLGGRSGTFDRRAGFIANMVRVAARHGPYPATCLPQSLTLWWLLRRRGIDSDLRIGVRKESSQLEAHAWVEHRGLVLGDGEGLHRGFAPFDRGVGRTEARPA
jgi:hypothetical protein